MGVGVGYEPIRCVILFSVLFIILSFFKINFALLTPHTPHPPPSSQAGSGGGEVKATVPSSCLALQPVSPCTPPPPSAQFCAFR